LIQQRVSEKIRPIIADVSVRKNLIFVLPVSEVLYHNNTVDITDEVIKSLDDAYNEGDLPDLEISLQEGV
jgi:Skp family chaperone for outer membrane proteins